MVVCYMVWAKLMAMASWIWSVKSGWCYLVLVSRTFPDLTPDFYFRIFLKILLMANFYAAMLRSLPSYLLFSLSFHKVMLQCCQSRSLCDIPPILFGANKIGEFSENRAKSGDYYKIKSGYTRRILIMY